MRWDFFYYMALAKPELLPAGLTQGSNHNTVTPQQPHYKQNKNEESSNSRRRWV